MNLMKTSLLEHVTSDSSVTMAQGVAWAHQMAMGLQYLTNAKIIHRDLALRNVLIDKNFKIRISDYGLRLGEKYLRIYDISIISYDSKQ